MAQAHDAHSTLHTAQHVGGGVFTAAVVLLALITAATLVYAWFFV